MFVYVHGGYFPVVLVLLRPLRQLRDGDVIEWYHSKGCSSGPLWAMKDVVTKGKITFSVQQNSFKLQKFCVSVEQSAGH